MTIDAANFTLQDYIGRFIGSAIRADNLYFDNQLTTYNSWAKKELIKI